ncbi:MULTISPECIES: acyl-CoA thioesterase [Streptomyces]|uniref:acyl-CoA thioesterase n=1 Tax=Streptomyces TaxID=1883 RepID=UPI0019C27A83|nr:MULTISPECIES: thioesterase family protein [Streptomyces]MCC2276593.1 acyl-CoA thioesterase [Streptomyces sp. ET3-23]GHF51110.1 thioesterase [Streptomyces morookaense]
MTISPRFSEVDVLGHVTNSAVPVWFEHGRLPIFRLFSKEPNMRDLALILRRYEIDFTRQIFASDDVVIETKVAKIGNTSITIEQTATQNGAEVAHGTCIMVHFDYERESTAAIPDHLRAELTALSA